MIQGGCNCGSVRYEMEGTALHHALCHCKDCRSASGAPASAWALVRNDQITITGNPKAYASSDGVERLFCDNCGTSLFYRNEAIFPDMIDVMSATLDDPDAIALGGQIQTAERIGWMAKLDELPAFPRFPAED